MDKVKSYIEKNKDRFLNELFELLRIPSISAQSDHKPDVLPTEGNPVVYAEKTVDPGAKTVLVYGHYDVMPVDPVDEWRTSPFEPVVKDGRIWCRGADDDKGQLFMHAKAFEAMCATDSLPCNVKFLLEGEEEIGSPSLYKFCADNKKMLENLFGKEMFRPKNIMERIKTFDDAFKELGENHPLVKEYLSLIHI